MTKSTNIFILIPEDEDDDINLVSYFTGQVCGDFLHAFDTGAPKHHDRADLGEIEITDVKLDGDIVEVSYEIDYFIYNGCKDIDECGTYERTIRGRKEGGYWVFERYAPMPTLYPNEEL